MKNWYVFIGIIYLFMSCDNTLDLVEEGTEVSVVYSLLSATDNEQVVRLEKGFIDQDIPATELAQDPDQLYYENAVVRLNNVTKGTSYTLSRKESSELGLEREDGFFVSSPNYIYHYNGNEDDFENNDEVELSIKTSEESEPITANITLLSDLLVLSPNTNFPTEAQYKIQWVIPEENPPVEYVIKIELHYKEANLLDDEPEFEDRMLTWNFGRFKNSNFAEAPGIDFYKLFGNNLEESPTLERTFEHFNIIIEYSGEEMEAFQNFLTANTGITSSQPLPVYSNLSSGLGLVAEKEFKVIENQFIGTATKDSLKDGRFTKNLNFR